VDAVAIDQFVEHFGNVFEVPMGVHLGPVLEASLRKPLGRCRWFRLCFHWRGSEGVVMFAISPINTEQRASPYR